MSRSSGRYLAVALSAALLLTACADAGREQAVPPLPPDDPVGTPASEEGGTSTTDVEAAAVPPADPLARVVLETERGYELVLTILEFEPWVEPGDPGFSMVRFRGSGSIENLTDRSTPPTGFTISASFDLADAPFAAGTNALGAPLLSSDCPAGLGSSVSRRSIETIEYCTAAAVGVWRPQTLEANQQVPVTWNRATPVFHVRDEDIPQALDLLATPTFIHVAAFEEGSGIEGIEVTQQLGELARQAEVLADVAGRMEMLDMGFRSPDYTFVGQAGDEIVIESRIGPHTADVYLYGPDGEEIAAVGSGQGRLRQSDPITLPATGSYVFAVSGFPNSGYEVRVTRRS